jgi:hypothetical protein
MPPPALASGAMDQFRMSSQYPRGGAQIPAGKTLFLNAKSFRYNRSNLNRSAPQGCVNVDKMTGPYRAKKKCSALLDNFSASR